MSKNPTVVERKVALYLYNVSYTIAALAFLTLVFFAFTNVHHVIIGSSATFVAFGILAFLCRRYLNSVQTV